MESVSSTSSRRAFAPLQSLFEALCAKHPGVDISKVHAGVIAYYNKPSEIKDLSQDKLSALFTTAGHGGYSENPVEKALALHYKNFIEGNPALFLGIQWQPTLMLFRLVRYDLLLEKHATHPSLQEDLSKVRGTHQGVLIQIYNGNNLKSFDVGSIFAALKATFAFEENGGLQEDLRADFIGMFGTEGVRSKLSEAHIQELEELLNPPVELPPKEPAAPAKKEVKPPPPLPKAKEPVDPAPPPRRNSRRRFLITALSLVALMVSYRYVLKPGYQATMAKIREMREGRSLSKTP